MKLFVLCMLVLGFSVPAMMQPPPPPPAATGSGSGQVKKFAGWPSISAISPSDGFVSLEGRFKIALPKSIQGFSTLTPNQTGTSATGLRYTWKFAEGDVVLFFLDFPDSALTGTAADLVQLTTNTKLRIVEKSPDAKLVSENQSILNGLPSSSVVYDLRSSYLSVQFYLDKRRLYTFNATFKDSKTESYVSSAFKSFRVIEQSDIEKELRNRYEAMKPPPLPQVPAIAKSTSDAFEDGLKGKPKKVVTESGDNLGKSSGSTRTLSSVAYYDQNGAITQRDYYDHRGNPRQVTVYGYIEGKRVSNSNSTSYEYDPPPAPAAISKVGTDLPVKRDSRYEFSFEYKYDNGKLIESQLIYNNGKKGMRTVYKYSPNQVERLVYTSEGELNQRYLSVLDTNGNEIERTDFGVVNFDIYGDRRYKHSYEFDTVGNWVKKSTLKEMKENGITSWEPAYISYRTITYY